MVGKFRHKRNGAPKPNGSRMLKNIVFVSVLVLIVLTVVVASTQSTALKEIPITQAVQDANAGQYSKIAVDGNELDITKIGDKSPSLKAFTEPNSTLKDEGFNYSKVQITAKADATSAGFWLQVGGTIIPILLIGGFL